MLIEVVPGSLEGAAFDRRHWHGCGCHCGSRVDSTRLVSRHLAGRWLLYRGRTTRNSCGLDRMAIEIAKWCSHDVPPSRLVRLPQGKRCNGGVAACSMRQLLFLLVAVLLHESCCRASATTSRGRLFCIQKSLLKRCLIAVLG